VTRNGVNRFMVQYAAVLPSTVRFRRKLTIPLVCSVQYSWIFGVSSLTSPRRPHSQQYIRKRFTRNRVFDKVTNYWTRSLSRDSREGNEKRERSSPFFRRTKSNRRTMKNLSTSSNLRLDFPTVASQKIFRRKVFYICSLVVTAA